LPSRRKPPVCPSRAGLQPCRGHPWPLFLPLVGGLKASIPPLAEIIDTFFNDCYLFVYIKILLEVRGIALPAQTSCLRRKGRLFC
jgi:hypothetical protein